MGGSFHGVKLRDDIFAEPGNNPAVGGSRPMDKWKRGALQRQERFQHVLHALGRLLRWASSERHEFMVRTMGVAPPSSKRVAQSVDKDLPDVENADVSGVHAIDEEDEDIEQDFCASELEGRCSFVVKKPAIGGSRNSSVDMNSAVGDAKQSLVDLLTDKIISSTSVTDAALELDTDLVQLPKSLSAQDIASVLAASSEQAQTSESMQEMPTPEHMHADSDDSDSVVDESIDSLPAQPINTDDPVVGGFMDETRIKALAFAFMGRVQDNELKSAKQQLEERSAFLALPRHNWILSLGKKTGKIMCVHTKDYEQLWRSRCVRKMPPREQFLTEVGPLFGKELFSTLSLHDLRQPFASLHAACNKTVWSLDRDSLSYDICNVMKNPPKELFLSVSLDQLSQQYARLRAWLQSLKETPFGHELYKPTSFLVQTLDLSNKPSGKPFLIDTCEVQPAVGSWGHRYVPKLPTKASTRKYGCILILAAHTEPDLTKFYQYVQSTSLDEIRCRDIWHIVVGFQFYVHTAVSSESLAEAVGSFLEVTRRHNTNGGMSVKHLVWSTQLRAHGLKGFGGEQGIMAYALNTHFRCTGPEGWHFIAKRVKDNKRCAAQVNNDVRLLSKPQWFQKYIFDLVTTGALTLCKTLPRPERAFLSSSMLRDSRWHQLTTYAKRQKLSEEADEEYNPKRLDDNLFKQLKITTLSLPSCLRPGKNPR